MGIGLTVNSCVIADVAVQAIQLRSLLGSYELAFSVSGTVHPSLDGLFRWLIVHGARIIVTATKTRQTEYIGFALTAQPTTIRQGESASAGMLLRLDLQPHQLEKLEALRDGGDLEFELVIAARGSDSQRAHIDWPEQAKVWMHVAESSWVVQLNAARFMDILLLEIPAPFSTGPLTEASRFLRRAREHFIKGNYRECVLECRQVTEELGGGGRALNGALDLFKDKRSQMSKDERQKALLGALRHYAHPAAHSVIEGGFEFNRADAKLALSVAAAMAARAADIA